MWLGGWLGGRLAMGGWVDGDRQREQEGIFHCGAPTAMDACAWRPLPHPAAPNTSLPPMCAGLKALMLGAQSIMLGTNSVVVAGGWVAGWVGV